MKSLESVKEWLDSCDIKYTEGPKNLNWLVQPLAVTFELTSRGVQDQDHEDHHRRH